MPPLSLVEPVKTRTLNIAEREKILAGINQCLSIRAIAASIERAPSTVSRELAENLRLRDEVQDRLEDEHSPEQIAAQLLVDFPDEPEMRVSYETIYQSLYVQGRGALRRDLAVRLRTGRALRKPRGQQRTTK